MTLWRNGSAHPLHHLQLLSRQIYYCPRPTANWSSPAEGRAVPSMPELAALPWLSQSSQGHPRRWVQPPAMSGAVPWLPALPAGSELGDAKGPSLLPA